MHEVGNLAADMIDFASLVYGGLGDLWMAYIPDRKGCFGDFSKSRYAQRNALNELHLSWEASHILASFRGGPQALLDEGHFPSSSAASLCGKLQFTLS